MKVEQAKQLVGKCFMYNGEACHFIRIEGAAIIDDDDDEAHVDGVEGILYEKMDSWWISNIMSFKDDRILNIKAMGYEEISEDEFISIMKKMTEYMHKYCEEVKAGTRQRII